MIRVVVFLVAVGLCALGAIWLADRPGEVAITWQGYRVETSVMVMIVAASLIALLAIAGWSVVRFVLHMPARLSSALDRRKQKQGYQAISRGLVAIGSGDAAAARRFAAEALRAAPSEPLALLLRAQTAQMAGDRKAAADAFHAMSRRGDTKLLGLRGLFIEAQRRDDAATARLIAEEATRSAPALPWAAEAALDFRCAAHDWDGALALVAANLSNGLLDKRTFRRQRAVLLTARALAAEDADRPAAKQLALEAVKLAPDLVPAAALAGRLLAESGDDRRAGRILETAWNANPHPDIADAYAYLRLSDSARDRLARVQRLALSLPGHVEGALAVARAAIDAREFSVARSALEPLLKAPTQRVALLMADLEQIEHGDEGRAREWIGRAVHAARDPAWTADGVVSDRWMPVSPVTGRLDAFVWRQPVAELSNGAFEARRSETALIEARGSDHASAEGVAQPAPSPAAEPTGTGEPRSSRRKLERVPDAIIPLVHAPDDPGPAAEPERDMELTMQAGGGWQKFRSLFR